MSSRNAEVPQPATAFAIFTVDVALFANNNLHADMIRVYNGIKLGVDNTYKFRDRFNYICGTCNIIKINAIADPINFGIIQNDTQEEVLKSVDDYYLKMILGSHKFMYKHFVEYNKILNQIKIEYV